MERTEEKISPRELTLIFKKDLFEQSELSFLKIVLSQFPGALFFPIRETEPESPAGRLQIRLRKPSVSVLLSQIPLLVLGEAETVHGSGQGSLCVIILLYASFLSHLLFRPLFLFLSPADVDILGSFGRIYQKRHTVIYDLRKIGRASCRERV